MLSILKTSRLSFYAKTSQISKSLQPKSLFFSLKPRTRPFHSKNAGIVHLLNTQNTNTLPSQSRNSYLNELYLSGSLEQALNYLDSMQKLDICVDQYAFIALVNLCERKRAHDEGLCLHSIASEKMTPYSVRLGNAFLSMFVRFGDMGRAWYVFGKMFERDLFSWNVLIGGYAKAGIFDKALCLYQKLLWVGGVKPDVYTFPCVLRTCGGVPDLKIGKEVHVHVIRFGFEADVDIVNALITMYVKCGDLGSARLVFDGMRRRDRISWNAMISGYFENEEFMEGLKLFITMREVLMGPDFITLSSIISACELLGDKTLGREIHGYVTKIGFLNDVSVCNFLMKMYSSFGNREEAEFIFRRMESKDVVSWNIMISVYDNNSLPEKAVETYKMMKADGIRPDEFTIASVISSCACLGELELGIKLHELAKRTGFISDVIVANTLIDMYSRCKSIDKALEVFQQIPVKDVISWNAIILGLQLNSRCFETLVFFQQMKLNLKPTSVTLFSVLSACATSCARIGALMRGKEIHAHALRTGVVFDGFLPMILLDMYVRCGRMKLAWNQFYSNKRDVSAWTILLTGYAEQGQGILAVELFNRMVDSKVNPDEVTFIALLCACSRSGMVTEGLEYFNSMQQKYLIIPNLKHYACIVDLLGRAGKLKEAYEFIQKIPTKLDAAIWGALLNACRIHQSVELGELAAEHIFATDRKNVGYYILLCKLYADSGKWDGVAKVSQMMREEGVTVDPGCSWMEVKGEVHAFVGGDNFHPRIKEINAVLDGFYEKMNAVGFSNSECGSVDDVEASKDEIFCGHSERLAIAYGLINTTPGMPIWVKKNLYMCQSCHNTIKFISKIVCRDFFVRDTEQSHHFKDGICSCNDEGYLGRLNRLKSNNI